MINIRDLVIYDGFIVNVVDVNDRITINDVFYKVADFEQWIDSSKLTELTATKENHFNLLQLFEDYPVYQDLGVFLIYDIEEQENCWFYNSTKIHNYQDFRNAYRIHYGKDLVFNDIIKSKLNTTINDA